MVVGLLRQYFPDRDASMSRARFHPTEPSIHLFFASGLFV